VERRVLRDLHERRREAPGERPLLGPSREEGLAGAVLPLDRLEAPRAPEGAVELRVDRGLEALEARAVELEPAPRDGADPERVDDLVTTEQARLARLAPRAWRVDGSSKSSTSLAGSRRTSPV
jgi:hypothetical protein